MLWRFFAGREDRLPVDGNLLLAMVAPRPCLMISGFNDEVANTWGDEQSLHSAEKVYALLGAQGKVGLYRVPGFHGANDMEVGLDFLDVGAEPTAAGLDFFRTQGGSSGGGLDFPGAGLELPDPGWIFWRRAWILPEPGWISG